MEYSVCVSAVYGTLPVPEAIRAVRAIGCGAYEFWDWRGLDLDAVAAAQAEQGLKLTGFCAGNRHGLNAPGERAAFLADLREDLRAARKLNAEMLLLQVGKLLPDVPRPRQTEAIAAGLRAAAPLAEDAGVVLAVEPLNTLVDHPGYFLERSAEACDIIRAVDSPAVRLLFDIYHQQITEGNLIARLTAALGLLCHVHVAGNPGRHEPLTDSEVCYPAVLRALKNAGYRGRVGLEYFPLRDPDEGLREIFARMPL